MSLLTHGMETADIGATAVRELYNQNFTELDPNRFSTGLASARPAAGTANRFYFATDTGVISWDNGSTWQTCLDPTLIALAGVTVAANKLVYATGADAFSTCDLTAVARTLLAGSTQAAMRSALGIVDIGQQITDIVGAASASEQILQQYTLPAALLQVGSRLKGLFKMTKNGTADTITVKLRLGTAGTTADTLLCSYAPGATMRGETTPFHFVVATSTALQNVLLTNNTTGSGSSTSAQAADIAISDVSNVLILSIAVQMGGTTDVPTLEYSEVEVKI